MTERFRKTFSEPLWSTERAGAFSVASRRLVTRPVLRLVLAAGPVADTAPAGADVFPGPHHAVS